VLEDRQIREEIIGIVAELCPRATLILFGSRAKEKNSFNSDFDLVIRSEERIGTGLYFQLLERVEILDTLKNIEIIDYHDLDEDFRRIVAEEGITWYDGSSADTVGKV